MNTDNAAKFADADGPAGFVLIEKALDASDLSVVSRWYNDRDISSCINAPRSLGFGVGTQRDIPDDLAVLIGVATPYAKLCFPTVKPELLRYNHVTIQRHYPGQGTPLSRDAAGACGPVTAIFTFDGDASYEFRAPEEEYLRLQTTDYQTYRINVPEQSLMLLGPPDARYLYTYQVSRQFPKPTPRVTITLRCV